MNCAVCGNPLPSGRAVFHCSCGVYVHAYCWEKHVLQAHQPPFETGAVDLDGNFTALEAEAREVPETEQAPEAEPVSEQVSDEQISSPAE